MNEIMSGGLLLRLKKELEYQLGRYGLQGTARVTPVDFGNRLEFRFFRDGDEQPVVQDPVTRRRQPIAAVALVAHVATLMAAEYRERGIPVADSIVDCSLSPPLANGGHTMQQPTDEQLSVLPQQIIGYRQLTAEELALINEVKEHAETTRDLLSRAHQLVEERTERNRAAGEAPQTSITNSGRWLSIGTTDLQKGFMAVVRAIAAPTTF